jgi:hypothetical protein
MGYLTIERFDTPKRFLFIKKMMIAFVILVVVPFIIFVVWAVGDTSRLTTVQTAEESVEYLNDYDRITVRD